MRQPRRVEPVFVERVWGRTDLAPLFGPQERRIGEVWFPLGDKYPLLVKFIFTDERLSVQVHPDDDYARRHENSRGKTEMWHVLDARPGATIALGFREPISDGDLRKAIADGSVVDRLEWVPVSAGDTLFAPAGVVHAIGAGISLCEIQENSDVTYRLFDYGRPRELHLERGLEVASKEPYEGHRKFPVVCEHFTTELAEHSGSAEFDIADEHLMIAIRGTGSIGGRPFRVGDVWQIPADAGKVRIDSESGATFLRTRCGTASS